MKICIPTEDDRGMNAEVAAHFGSAPCFTMVDVESEEVTVKQNPACGHHPSHCHHIDILRAHGVDAVVCGGIGRRALDALENAGIAVLLPPQRGVRDVLRAVRSGEATPLTLEQACSGGGGHRHHAGHGHDSSSCGGRQRARVRGRSRGQAR